MESSDDNSIDECISGNSQIIPLTSNVESDSDSEFEEHESMMKWGRSPLGKAPNKNRNLDGPQRNLFADYFSGDNSTYDERYFERSFRMPRSVFNMLSEAVIGQGLLVKHRTRNVGPTIEHLCRFVGALRLLHADNSFDITDEHDRMS